MDAEMILTLTATPTCLSCFFVYFVVVFI